MRLRLSPWTTTPPDSPCSNSQNPTSFLSPLPHKQIIFLGSLHPTEFIYIHLTWPLGHTAFIRVNSAHRFRNSATLSQVAVDHRSTAAVLMASTPPFLTTYKNLLHGTDDDRNILRHEAEADGDHYCVDLPLIDLSRLDDELEAEQCRQDIVAAASEWGFFQVVNHGISNKLLARLRAEQVKMFRQPFKMKANKRFHDFSEDSYRWGTPTATSLKQLSWSEAYHIPLSSANRAAGARASSSRYVIEEISEAMSQLADELVNTLAQGLGRDGRYIKESCARNMCYLRLNRYPPCPIPGKVFGLVPHTDSDFITILCQDKVNGLQLNKGGRWITVKPNPNTLIINIGDLFQAWSNGIYKSVEHRVMPNPHQERFSVAYFVCPCKETMIESNGEPAIYRKFSFGEYRQQVQEDVRLTGYKVGLTRFLA